MTVNWIEVTYALCVTWVVSLFLLFLINFYNNIHYNYRMEVYFKSMSCFTRTETFENETETIDYCGGKK